MATLFVTLLCIITVCLAENIGVLTVGLTQDDLNLNVVIGVERGGLMEEVGTAWLSKCSFSASSSYEARYSRHHCNQSGSGMVLTVEWRAPTARDQAEYVCGNGALIPGALFNCSASFHAEARNSGASAATSVGVLILLTCLSLYRTLA